MLPVVFAVACSVSDGGDSEKDNGVIADGDGSGTLVGDGGFEVSMALLSVCEDEGGWVFAHLVVTGPAAADCGEGSGPTDPCSSGYNSLPCGFAGTVWGNFDVFSAAFREVPGLDDLRAASYYNHLFQSAGECPEYTTEHGIAEYEGEVTNPEGTVTVDEADGSTVTVDVEGLSGTLAPVVCLSD